ncbi:MAG TPA: hypothetical protein VF116_07290 [Ktedonobacterales bacterium]
MAERDERVLDNPETAYERTDVRLMIIGVLAIVTVAFLVTVPLVLRSAYYHTLAGVDRQLAVTPPTPELQVDPRSDLAEFRNEESARLNSYGWVDRGKGVVHIPIARAMSEIAAKGIPDFPKASP